MRKTKLELVAALFLVAVCGVLPSSGSVTKARLGDLTRNSQVVTDLDIGTNDVSEAIAGLLTTNISVRIDANTKRINTLYTKTAFLSLSNDINSARISGLSDVTYGQGAQISNLNARVRAFTPYEAYATLTQLSPTIRITDGIGSGIGFYVRCTDSQYHDLRDALKSGTLDPAGRPYPTMDYALTNLYGRTFTTNYLSALYGGDVSWTSNLTVTATNVASSLSAVCGGTGYPLCYGREATVRELLCDILYLDPTVWRDDAAASGHVTDATDFSGLGRTVGAALTYARYGHAETAQLRHDYEDGPAFGTPLLTYVRHAVPGSTSLAISPDTVDVIDVSNAVSLVTIRPQMPSPGIDDRRTASCSALIRVHAETTVRVLAQSWDEYIGNRVFTATPGDHLLTVDRVAMPDGWNATYCARLYSLDYQLLPPNFTTNNVILVNTVTNLVAPWALFGQPKPEGGGGSGNVDTNAVRDILKDGLTAAVTNGWTVGTGTNAVAYRLPTVVGVTNAAYAVVSNAVESWALKGKGYPTPAELGALPDNYDILITNVAFTGAVERVTPPADYSTSNATLVATIDSRIGGGGQTVSYVTRDPDDNNDRTAVTVGGRPAVGSVDAWSPYKDYNQGDLVSSNGVVYVCIAPPNVTVEHSDWTNQVAYWRQTVVGVNSFAAGTNNVAAGANTHAAGLQANAEGTATLAEGVFSHADGTATHAEGVSTYATGLFTHAEGTQTRASGMGTHAEGNNTEASGLYTHAEGLSARASGWATHAEGHLTAAAGLGSHAEGSYTVAGSHGLTSGSGTATVYRVGAHAAGWGAVATNQTAFVWQGLSGDRDAFEEPEGDEYYADHGAGTFNLNPVGGLRGVWIGATNLADHIDAGLGGARRIASEYGLSVIYADGSWVTRTNATAGVVLTNNLCTVAAAQAMTNDITFVQLKYKPDTLSGYGITDAYTKTELDGTSVTNGGATAYADATFRTRTDNVCHANTYTDWVAGPNPHGTSMVGQPYYTGDGYWWWNDNAGRNWWFFDSYNHHLTNLISAAFYEYGADWNFFEATRIKYATANQPFVTGDNVPSTNGLVTASVTNGLATRAEIPTVLPNPNALTFAGTASGSYDGSSPLTVTIPEGMSAATATNIAEAVSGQMYGDMTNATYAATNTVKYIENIVTNTGTHFEVGQEGLDLVKANQLVFSSEYELTNLTAGATIELFSGRTAFVQVAAPNTNLTVNLRFPTSAQKMGDALLRIHAATNGLIGTLRLNGSTAFVPLGCTDDEWKFDAGEHLYSFDKTAVTNGVAEVWVGHVKSER